ncbi:hypothetical protein MF406_05905 [Georgenia sp. TF02-10]|uniref:hypothetical protein n=1 Tax=Georgenia sp. TF02-10 TaxID=2917725 RepID=UPI001FA7FD27|nr:hypothetical protein [Georgenia sp. TF02-10]UNX55767.1 hypothetical protein MF406_05905 [Georgenia sp. TF02-10]
MALRGALTGGALLPADAGLGGLWAAARSGWVATGDGAAGPADPLLTVLAVGMLPLAPFGASTSVLLAALVVLAVPLAGLGAWFAAGAATRAVTVRAWAAALWALAPTLLVAAGQGRVGAVLAHLALPWVALGIARAVGVERRDVIASGLVGARRVRRPGSPAGAGAGPAEDGPTTGTGTTATGRTGATVVPAAAAGGRTGATAGAAAAAAGRTGATAAPESDRTGTTTAAGRTGGTVAQGPPELPAGQAAEAAPAPGPAVPDPRPARTGSIAAGAGAALALAVAAAGAPALLPAAVVAVVLLAPVLPRHRLAVLAVPLPAVALLGPLLHAATADLPGGSWRLLLADPGPALATAAPEACVSALGWPVPPPAPDGWPAAVAPYLALAGGAALVLAAAAALLRGGGRARAVRAGWLLAVLGLVLMLGSARVDVALGTDLAGAPAVARGWPGAGLSLAVLGLLLAAVAGADGVRGALAARSFGVAQVGVAVLALAAVLGPALTTAGWLRAVPDEPALLALTGRTRVPVPAVAAEMQGSPARARVLALTPQDGTVRAELWRGPGRQLTETAAAAAARPLTGAPTASVVPADDADADLAGLVARLAVGAAEDAGPELGAHAIGVVLVPPVGDVAPADDAETDGGGADAETDGGGADGGAAVDEAAADDAARTDLIARLDATAGLERVTENATGVVWRVATAAGAEGAAPSVARARVLADGETVQDVDAEVVGIDTKLPNGPEGRTLVLAERADPGWRAWYDGRPLRAVPQGWQQAFELPAHTGTLTLTYAAPWSTLWSWVQGVVLGLAVLLAVPVRRRRSEED